MQPKAGAAGRVNLIGIHSRARPDSIEAGCALADRLVLKGKIDIRQYTKLFR